MEADTDVINIEEENIFSDNVMDYSQKQILSLDKNFDFKHFIEGAKGAFQTIVLAYKTGKIEEVKSLLSKEVYDNFKKVTNTEKINKKEEVKDNITSIEAAILNIEVIQSIAKIKVEFLSYLEGINRNSKGKDENIRDVWTFQKDMKNNSPNWTLIEVSAE